jgi:adenylate kinase
VRAILLGAPGAGKGTQAEFLAEKFHIPMIATGTILRAAVQAGTPLGQKVKSIMERGELVPDNIMIELVKERLTHEDCNKGYLLDGFPRTLTQAQALAEAGVVLDYVIEIYVADDEIVKRLSGRRTHLASGRVYHIAHNPPKVPDQDDQTGEPLVLRDDDKETTVRDRLRVYHEKTEPLVGYYRDLSHKEEHAKPRYIRVEGIGSIKDIQHRIVQALTLRCRTT